MEIRVYADWTELGGPQLMGTLSVVHTRGREVFSFSYATTWLKTGFAQQIDPDLQYYSGPQYLTGTKSNFGLFLDSAPDRWGRVLMERREAINTRREGRTPKKLFEEDYLLGVYDLNRIGAIRFKLSEEGSFLNDQPGLTAPPFTSLRELENASLLLENETLADDEVIKWVNLLIAPGASLGGARPKASVTNPEDGHLWIAKFPSTNDKTDIGGWEMVINELAGKAGVNIAAGMVRRFNNQHHTYLVKRFDRGKDGQRIHFASAMTLLGKTDGEEGNSYLELAAFIMQNGANVQADLQELWRRIVFSICISNTDDHLRNHGFLLTKGGWILSPAYDLNPNRYGQALTLNISENDNSLDLELARSVATYFRVNPQETEEIISSVQQAVNNWRAIASRYNISRPEQEMMEPAFRMC